MKLNGNHWCKYEVVNENISVVFRDKEEENSLLPFLLDQKGRKNQGKTNRSARFPGPTHRNYGK